VETTFDTHIRFGKKTQIIHLFVLESVFTEFYKGRLDINTSSSYSYFASFQRHKFQINFIRLNGLLTRTNSQRYNYAVMYYWKEIN